MYRMKAGWKKAVWALLMIQLLLAHLALLGRGRATLDWLSWKGSVRLGLPLWFYGKGALLLTGGLLAVAALLLVIDYVRYTSFRRKCLRAAEEVTDERIVRLCRKAAEEAGLQIKTAGKAYVCEGLSSPFVAGFRHPVLFFPRKALEEENGYLMFLHECIHIRRKDTQYKLLLLLLCRLLWFQPLAYLARQLGFRDVEVSCDEAVLAGKSRQERLSYGQFLTDSLCRAKEGEAYSAFFLSSAAIMKARIRAVTQEGNKTEAAARIAVILLAAELGLFGGWLAREAAVSYREAAAAYNLYAGYELPPHFTQQALEEMLALEGTEEEAYYEEVQSGRGSWVESYEELSVPAEGPWQIRLKDTGRYADCLLPFMERYLCYFGRQEWESGRNCEDSGYSPLPEGVYTRLLAGDGQEAVFAVICREYLSADSGKEETLAEAESGGWGQTAYEDGAWYAYYSVALHIERKEEHVYELAGIVSLEEATDGFARRYPQEDYSDIPQLRLKGARDILKASDASSVSGVADAVSSAGGEWEVSLETGKLRIREGGGEWMEAGVTEEELFERGDQMDGALSALQEGSWQCDGIKQIFAYGGAYDYETQTPIPVRVTWYDEAEGGFRESVVTDAYTGVRRLFVTFPENASEGYLILTSDRTMWQEGNVVFHTADGGASWEKCACKGLDYHSLTMDGGFLTNEIGFIGVNSSQSPLLYVTFDGGATWETAQFDGVPESYTICYLPEWEAGEMTLYVSMEGYSRDGGVKARFVTRDNGLHWTFDGYALRK